MFGVLVSFVLVSGTLGTSLISDVIDVIETADSHTNCSLPRGWELKTCFDDAGSPIAPSGLRTARALSVCENTKGDTLVCLQNGVSLQLLNFSIEGHTEHGGRIKRGFFSFLGSALGAFYGPVGALVGGLVGYAVDGIICVFTCHSSRVYIPPPNRPPQIDHCAKVTTPTPVVADKLKETAVVQWSEVQTTDPDGDSVSVSVSPSNVHSGGKFSNGRHTVLFGAKDPKGLSAYCVVDFDVKVVTCQPPRWPDNGELACNGHLYGSVCTVTCDNGYTGRSTTECLQDGSWSQRVEDCKPVECKRPVPAILNGQMECPRQAVYDEICMPYCDDGYSLKGPHYMECNADGDWGRAPTCEDTVPPYLVFCPASLQVDIDESDNRATVNWTLPRAHDNTKDIVNISELHGLSPGVRLDVGVHKISYTITDKAGNLGRSCDFEVTVKTVDCDQPDLQTSKYLSIDCEGSYVLGTVCNVACSSNFPPTGAKTIECKFFADGKHGWTWNPSETKPSCNDSVCALPTAPANGALVTKRLTNSDMVQLQCQEGFDIPPTTTDGIYLCAHGDSQWSPPNQFPLPNCSRSRHPGRIQLPSQLYYYAGECNTNQAFVQSVKEHFATALDTSKYGTECGGACTITDVNITCGPVTSRKRRGATSFDGRLRRSAKYAYVVDFKISIPFDLQSMKAADAYSFYDDMLYDVTDQLDKEVQAGAFNIGLGDLHVDSDSFAPGYTELDCAPGTMQRVSKGSCVGCPVGFYLSKTGSKPKCLHCPIGTYQDGVEKEDCKPCPLGTNTTASRSENRGQCLDICGAGTFSNTGVVPCTPCQIGWYKPSTGSMRCLQCEMGKITKNAGSVQVDECIAFDVTVTSQKSVQLNHSGTPAQALSLSVWIQIPGGSSSPGVRITSPDPFYIEVLFSSSGITLDVNSRTSSISDHDFTQGWSHFGLEATAGSNSIVVYLNGAAVHRDDKYTPTSGKALTSGSYITVIGDITLSAFSVKATVNTSDMSTLSRECQTIGLMTSLFSSSDLAETRGTDVIVPSQCDAIDDCASSPCGSQQCENTLTGFVCHCLPGYSGDQCEVPPDVCYGNGCQNGATCNPVGDNYTCSCAEGFSGQFCTHVIVNGQWSNWTEWTSCSKSCDGGLETRTRICNNPAPGPDGRPCIGDVTESRACNTEECPECSRLRRPLHGTIECNDTSDGTKKCVAKCNPGFGFSTSPLPVYECGDVTSFKWNHVTTDNPHGLLPACSEVKSPSQLSLDIEGAYETVSCTPEHMAAIISDLQRKTSSLPCSQSGTCTPTVTSSSCGASSRSKRSTGIGSHVTVKIELAAKINDSNLDLPDFYRTKSVTPGLQELIRRVQDLERAAQLVYNNSLTYFQVTLDGRQHTVNTSGLSVEPRSVCPPGTVWRDVICTVAPPGSHANGTMAELCARGYYQDQSGQSTCKACPAGKTTQTPGSISLGDCTVDGDKAKVENIHLHVELKTQKGGDDHGTEVTTKLAIGLSVSLVTLLGLFVAGMLYYKLVVKKRQRVGESYVDLKMFASEMPSKTVFKGYK